MYHSLTNEISVSYKPKQALKMYVIQRKTNSALLPHAQGIADELKSCEVYRNEACCFHERFTVTDSRLNLNTNWPMLGASS